MALINCSECGKEISNKADKCPNCGNPINNIHGEGEGCFMQTLNVGCVITAVIIGIIILVFFFALVS